MSSAVTSVLQMCFVWTSVMLFLKLRLGERHGKNQEVAPKKSVFLMSLENAAYLHSVLPWQQSAESGKQLCSPSRAHALQGASVLI